MDVFWFRREDGVWFWIEASEVRFEGTGVQFYRSIFPLDPEEEIDSVLVCAYGTYHEIRRGGDRPE